MNDNNIFFGANLSIGVLNVNDMELRRVESVNKNHEIFKRISVPFDWYFHDNIMIIPDSVPKPKKNWNENVNICGQEIECVGEFIYFFHFEIIENINFVSSLKLPEYIHIKKGMSL